MSGSALILLLFALACPVGMGLMMLFMRKKHDGSRAERSDEDDEPSA